MWFIPPMVFSAETAKETAAKHRKGMINMIIRKFDFCDLLGSSQVVGLEACWFEWVGMKPTSDGLVVI